MLEVPDHSVCVDLLQQVRCVLPDHAVVPAEHRLVTLADHALDLQPDLLQVDQQWRDGLELHGGSIEHLTCEAQKRRLVSTAIVTST
jgi:hypothetical protein